MMKKKTPNPLWCLFSSRKFLIVNEAVIVAFLAQRSHMDIGVLMVLLSLFGVLIGAQGMIDFRKAKDE